MSRLNTVEFKSVASHYCHYGFQKKRSGLHGKLRQTSRIRCCNSALRAFSPQTWASHGRCSSVLRPGDTGVVDRVIVCEFRYRADTVPKRDPAGQKSAWFTNARFRVTLGVSVRTLIPRWSGFTWVPGCRAGASVPREPGC